MKTWRAVPVGAISNIVEIHEKDIIEHFRRVTYVDVSKRDIESLIGTDITNIYDSQELTCGFYVFSTRRHIFGYRPHPTSRKRILGKWFRQSVWLLRLHYNSFTEVAHFVNDMWWWMKIWPWIMSSAYKYETEEDVLLAREIVLQELKRIDRKLNSGCFKKQDDNCR